MAKLKLQLTAGQYDQPVLDKDGNFNPLTGQTTRRSKGETFEANSQEEYDRLLGAGAAVDPDVAADEEAARLRARLDELETEKAATQAALSASERQAAEEAAGLNPADLKGKELDAALTERGLSTDGTADEKRTRLSEALAPTPTWA